MDKTEKYLKSIDNTLSEILKELKYQRRVQTTQHITLDAKSVSDMRRAEKLFETMTSSEYL